MSRVNQIVSNTNTIVKKIVVGTPIKRVSGILNNINSTGASEGQILVFDSATQTFRPEFFSDTFANIRAGADKALLIDSAWISARVDPNLVPAITIDSALVLQLIDSNYIGQRALIDSNDITRIFPVLNDIDLSEGSGDTIVTSKSIIPDGTGGISLGTIDRRFTDLFVEANSVVIGNIRLSESDGNLLLERIDDSGFAVIGAKPNFQISDSNLSKVTSIGFDPTLNTLSVTREGADTLTAVINSFTDPTIQGTLKGPSEFVIDPIPYNSPLGRVTINGRLYIAGDELISDATTLKFPNTKTFQLGENLDSDVDANGGGLILGGAGASITYRSLTDRWVSNKEFEAPKFYGKYVGFESDLALYNTDNIPEGSTNLYFTNTRADARINNVVDATYINALVDIPEAGTDSAAVINIVTGLIDSSYSRTLTELLDDLDSARAFISSYVDSSYVQSRFLAIGGELTSVEVEPAGSQYVFTTALNELVLEDSDDNGNVLSFSPTNVDVHKNGLMLIKGVDFSTNDGTEIFLGEPSDENDVYVVTSSRRQSYNFYNALTDSSQTIPNNNNTSVDIFSKADYRFVKYTITAEVLANNLNKYQASEILVTHNNTDAFYTEYGIVQAQDSSLGDITVVVDGANVKVKFDPAYSNTTVKFSKNSL